MTRDGPAGVPALTLPGRFKAAVFDFDGLLVDSEPGWGRAEGRLLARYGHVQTAADRRATVGRSIDDSVAVHLARIGRPDVSRRSLSAELLELACEEYAAGPPLRPGALALVEGLAGRIPLAVASNTYRLPLTVALAATPFGSRFQVIAASDEVARGKPAPDVYLLACERLGVAPRDAIAFEDSLSGVLAARAAGLVVVAVPEDPREVEGLATHVRSSLEDLAIDPA